jgi:hypothetical protein
METTNMTESKLSAKLKNVPTDTSLVCSSTNDGLNRVERLGDRRMVLVDNLGEENQLPVKRERYLSRLDVKVFVVNMRRQPLMPTTPRKARILLKNGRAKVIQRTPFVIQLNYPTSEFKQLITLGIDAGYSKIGFSAITEKKELIAGEVSLRTNISKNVDVRRNNRRNRRSRLWYRKPRFNNRKKSKPKGWLAPSIKHKLDSHIRLVEKINHLLPITSIIIEVASFDIQKIQNPYIIGVEYQQGTLFGYTIRNYLLEKWDHRCVYCQKKDIPLEVDHIIPRSRNGTDRVDNLTIACKKCNLRKGNKLASECSAKLRHIILTIQRQAKKKFRSATFMTMVRWKMVEQLDCQYTYGDTTKYRRTRLGISKSHANDAFIIAGGSSQEFSRLFEVKQIRRNNRSLQKNRKGFRRTIRKHRYPYQPNDLVRYNNQLYRVNGTHCKGARVLLFTPKQKRKTKSVSIQKIDPVIYGKGLSFTLNSSRE